jgi:hypothetical protein
VADRDDRQFGVRLAARSGAERHRPPVAVISNFTPVPRDFYRVPLPKAGTLARDHQHRRRLDYGGSGKGNLGMVMAEHPIGWSEGPARDAASAAACDTDARIRDRTGLNNKGGWHGVDAEANQPLARDAMAYVLAGGRGSGSWS